MKKLFTIVALATSVMAAPAFAQSFDQDFGTGNVLPSHYGTTTLQVGKTADRQSGLNAYAMIPEFPRRLPTRTARRPQVAAAKAIIRKC
jgi:hypothetical protein